MTSRVSHDPVERLSGIVLSPNARAVYYHCYHCPSLSNLVHYVSTGNCEAGVLSALLPADAGLQASPSSKQDAKIIVRKLQLRLQHFISRHAYIFSQKA